MVTVLKKIITFLCIAFVLTVSVSANLVSPFDLSQLTPSDDFIIYNEKPQEVAEILKTDTENLDNTVKEKNILYLAVNQDNTKQIQLTSNENDFSNSVINLSNFTNDSINSLLPDITGLNNVKGEIVFKDTQKFVKINLRNDEGKYVLTQYFTVMDKKIYTLSFYTSLSVDTDYIETTFVTTKNKAEETKPDNNLTLTRFFLICGTLIFGCVCVILIFTIVKDLIPNKTE